MEGKTELKIPLSYNEIDSASLQEVLSRYDKIDHHHLVHDFEVRVAGLMQSPHAVSLSSGTAAVHLALKIAGVKQGDLVMVPTFTYVATVSPVLYVGATPYFIDSEPKTWNMDPDLLETAIAKVQKSGRRIGAIIIVHNYGIAARIHRFKQIARDHGIVLIEDAAESLGTMVDHQPTGTHGDIGVLSFNNNKILTCFGGGALLIKDDSLASRARYLASHARSDVPWYLHEEVGYNYRMSPLQAAYGLGQLANLDKLQGRRIQIDHYYREELSGKGFNFQDSGNASKFVPWLTACLLPASLNPLDVLNNLASLGIESRRLWNPMHRQPAFAGHPTENGVFAEMLFERGICLPMGGAHGSVSAICDPVIKALIDRIP